MADWDNVLVDEIEEDKNAYWWYNGECINPKAYSSDCTIVHSVSGRERGDNGGDYYEIASQEAFELTIAFTETPNPALDESCYNAWQSDIESSPLSVEFEVEHNSGYSSADYRLGDYRPEESDSSDSDTGLLGKTIELLGTFSPDPRLKTVFSILSFINWGSYDPIVVDSETNDIAPHHYIHWDMDHDGDNFPTIDEPTAVNFIVEADPAGSSYGWIDTWARYTVAVFTYLEDMCPCGSHNAAPVATTITPTSLSYTFENIA